MDGPTDQPTKRGVESRSMQLKIQLTWLYRTRGVGLSLESSTSKLDADKLIHRRMDRLTEDSL